MRKTPLIVGNWKMHCLKSESLELARVIAEAASGFDAEMVICPPTIWLDPVATFCKKASFRAQDCHMAQFGAHTGDIAAAMLKDVGCRYVLLVILKGVKTMLKLMPLSKQKPKVPLLPGYARSSVLVRQKVSGQKGRPLRSFQSN